MTIKLGIVMDPIETSIVKKSTDIALLLEAQRRHWTIEYMEQKDLFCLDGQAFAYMSQLTVHDDAKHWFDRQEASKKRLGDLDVILMRKDPPFDMEFIYSTYLLELAEREGTLIVNKPQALRDANEKFSTTWFPQCAPPTLVAREATRLHEFLDQHQDIIVKPLDGMGGKSIFRIQKNDHNINVILETLTHYETRYIMAQLFIPDIISNGDKRILLIDGEPIDYALTRLPPAGETRANLAVGGKGVGVELNERDRWICQQLAPMLKQKGILFAGIDVIGDYVTEINITSPTCVRELDAIYNVNICEQLFDVIEKRIHHP